MKFSHVRLLVSNVQECFYFYKDVLGFDIVWGDENSPYVEFETGNTKIAINERRMIAEVVGKSNSPSEVDSQDNIALIFAVEDVDRYFRVLRDKGVNFINEPQTREDWGIRLAHFRDPAGNLIEINQGL
ncbi:MAG: VOC family protein [Candidatus Cohnella colombiensis]|uniref:VOC family protein n=1 Tax=Candidatus Cohnella colombiensis TaxID=3121368 RepID=A0AA95F1S7_9BACL|nr:MAG: VOC family protein [Cohnella sp.]